MMDLLPEAKQLFRFWFDAETQPNWFKRSEAFDASLKKHFFDVYRVAKDRGFLSLKDTPDVMLANILVFDQLPRNLYRGLPQAFASDTLALYFAKKMVRTSAYKKLATKDQKAFCCMPFMHSEDLEDQKTCITLFEAMDAQMYLNFAQRHKKIIERFGRFPHRNEILGRLPRSEETAWLNSSEGESF